VKLIPGEKTEALCFIILWAEEDRRHSFKVEYGLKCYFALYEV
jgi:hypothetical protein